MKMRLIGQYFTFVVIALALVGLVGCSSSDNRSNSNDEYLVYADSSGLILEGYDPVAFFTEAKAVKGSPTHKLTHQGATYHFAAPTQHRNAIRFGCVRRQQSFFGIAARMPQCHRLRSDGASPRRPRCRPLRHRKPPEPIAA